MNKRIKKKKHIYPFIEYGIEIDAEWVKQYALIMENPKEEQEYTACFEALLTKIEELGLCCGGGSNNNTIGFYISTCKKDQSSIHKYNMDKLVGWMNSTGWWKNIKLSEYSDAWHNNRKLLPQEIRKLVHGELQSPNDVRTWIDNNDIHTVQPGIVKDLIL